MKLGNFGNELAYRKHIQVFQPTSEVPIGRLKYTGDQTDMVLCTIGSRRGLKHKYIYTAGLT